MGCKRLFQLPVISVMKIGNKTRAVNVRYELCDVYCGRASSANTLRSFGQSIEDLTPKGLPLGFFGNRVLPEFICRICKGVHLDTEKVDLLTCTIQDIGYRLRTDPTYRSAVLDLEGKTLGCWCKPKICHVDIIVFYIENGQLPKDVDECLMNPK